MLRAYGGEPYGLERFLVANAHSVPKAEAAWRASFAFRAELELDEASGAAASRNAELRGAELVERGLVSNELVERMRGVWFGAYQAHTSDGSAVHYAHITCDPREFTRRFSEDEVRRFYVWWMEQSLALQNARQPPGTPWASWCAMIDITDLHGFGVAMLHLPSLQLLARTLRLGQLHYPENLRRAYILSAPSFFAAGWRVVSPAIAPPTRAKVAVLPEGDLAPLAAILGVEGEARIAEMRSRVREDVPPPQPWCRCCVPAPPRSPMRSPRASGSAD